MTIKNCQSEIKLCLTLFWGKMADKKRAKCETKQQLKEKHYMKKFIQFKQQRQQQQHDNTGIMARTWRLKKYIASAWKSIHKKTSSLKAWREMYGIQKFQHKKWHGTNTLHEKAWHEKTWCEQTWCEKNMPWLTTNSWATSILCNQTNDYRNHCMKKHSIQTSRHEKWHCMQKHGMKKALCEEHVMKIRL